VAHTERGNWEAAAAQNNSSPLGAQCPPPTVGAAPCHHSPGLRRGMSPRAACCPCLWLGEERGSALPALPGHLQHRDTEPPLPGAAPQARHPLNHPGNPEDRIHSSDCVWPGHVCILGHVRRGGSWRKPSLLTGWREKAGALQQLLSCSLFQVMAHLSLPHFSAQTGTALWCMRAFCHPGPRPWLCKARFSS